MTAARRSRRRETLTRDRVLRAAVDVVDQEGMEALSMRRLGQELGVEAMSLYRYVPSKADLLDGIYGMILEDIVVPRAAGDWKRTARAYARAFRKALTAHPNTLSLFATRPAVTPASLRHVESGLALLRGVGFDTEDAVSAFQVLVTFVVGHTLSSHAPAREDERSTPAYRDLDPAEFPALLEAAATLADRDLDQEFEFGLDVVLAGLSAKLS
jgi:TetR/AcrR family transcriptional regulator, tetracycline repressor protein